MSNDGESHEQAANGVIHVIEVASSFGTVFWTPEKRLYDLLPRNERNELLDITGERVICPYFSDITDKILKHTGQGHIDNSSLGIESSAETIEITCQNAGTILWCPTQDLWDLIPSDQRSNMLEFTQMIIHMFMEEQLAAPLYRFAVQQFR